MNDDKIEELYVNSLNAVRRYRGLSNMTDEEKQKKKIEYISSKIDQAYLQGPFGTFWERWIPFLCKHPLIRCTHGDEIHARRGRRRVCMFCGRALKGPIPKICFFTGEPHSTYFDARIKET